MITSRHVVYLGDGAYCREGSYQGEIVLYTSDGVTEKNHVVLDPGAFETLKSFVSALYASYVRAKEDG
jgi:hypothetical protein